LIQCSVGERGETDGIGRTARAVVAVQHVGGVGGVRRLSTLLRCRRRRGKHVAHHGREIHEKCADLRNEARGVVLERHTNASCLTQAHRTWHR
jgi:hypothetical protein